jgi:hypothetical protein
VEPFTHKDDDYFGGFNSDEESHRSVISARRAFFKRASRSGLGGIFLHARGLARPVE